MQLEGSSMLRLLQLTPTTALIDRPHFRFNEGVLFRPRVQDAFHNFHYAFGMDHMYSRAPYPVPRSNRHSSCSRRLEIYSFPPNAMPCDAMPLIVLDRASKPGVIQTLHSKQVISMHREPGK